MSRRRTGVLVLAGVTLCLVTSVAAVACSSGGGGSTGDGNCAPEGTALHLQARNTTFDASCLAAPAGQKFTETFENQDPGVPHSFQILEKDPAQVPDAKLLFKGKVVSGPLTTTYDVSALNAGTYFFQCQVHPSKMNGTFVVE